MDSVLVSDAVVALDQQILTAECSSGYRMHRVDLEAPAEVETECLIRDRVRQPFDRRLEDVRRRRAALGESDPPVIVHHDRQLVLHAGQREAELAVGVGVHRPPGELVDQLGQACLVQPLDVAAGRRRYGAGLDDTDCAGGVAAELLEQSEHVPDADAELAGKHLAWRALGQQAAEERGHRVGAECPVEGQRVRERGTVTLEPARVVGELQPTATVRQRAGALAEAVDVKRPVGQADPRCSVGHRVLPRLGAPHRGGQSACRAPAR